MTGELASATDGRRVRRVAFKRAPRPFMISRCGSFAYQFMPCGKAILVDASDSHLLAEYLWSSDSAGYAIAYVENVDGKPVFIKLHREIMAAARTQIVDHVNGDRLDCRRKNLRFATKSQNAANSRLIRSASGYKGVKAHKRRMHMAKPYTARITVNYKEIHLGWFSNPEDAAKAYDAAAIQYFGEFAVTNISLGLFAKINEIRV